MNAKKFSDAMSELDTKYVDEALNYKTKMKKPIWIKWGIMTFIATASRAGTSRQWSRIRIQLHCASKAIDPPRAI